MSGKSDINTPQISENISLGYIKLYRSITKKAWYKKSAYMHLFSHLLLQASHSGYNTWFNGASRELEPGQLVTGRKKLSNETGISQSMVYRILKCFQNEQQIEQQATRTSSLITIVNWNQYQKSEQPFEQQLNSGRTTDEQPLDTIQEGKEGFKNEKKDKKKSGGGNSFKKEEDTLYNLDQCLIEALKQQDWVDENKINQEELKVFNSYLTKIGEKSKTLKDYKKHFVNLKAKWPEKVTPPKKYVLMEEYRRRAREQDEAEKLNQKT